jgi:glyoxylase-like metal-dependent hydrolase (beta-lactamase superfamily II)
MQKIADHVWSFSGLLLGRVYLIADSDGLTIIDAGLPSSPSKILRQLAAAGHKATDVKRILITHAHSDHTGGLPKLKAATSATVMASAPEAEVISGKKPIARPPKSEMPFFLRPINLPPPNTPLPTDRILSIGETLPEVLGGLQVLDATGHAPGQVAFWQPQQGILFCGDALMNMRKLNLPFLAFTTSKADAIKTIKYLATLTPKLICFGHGKPLANPQKLTALANSL